MKLKQIDHIVIPTHDLQKCLRFYVDLLGMEYENANGYHALRFGNQKFNVHPDLGTNPLVAAEEIPGSQDLCIVADGDIHAIKDEIDAFGWPRVTDVVERHGAMGVMDSVYVRDPDGNLIEISVYRNEK